jgi:hypothetical protein
MNPSTGIKPWQWVVTIIVIIVIIVLIVKGLTGGDSKTNGTGSEINNGQVNTSKVLSQRIVMTDQFPGNIVYLSSVELSNPGFVGIYTDNAGKPGVLLGNQYFEAGISPGRIVLSQPTIDGRTYHAVLYTDDGDKVLNPAKDAIAKDVTGKDIIRTFKASSNIDEDKG